MQKVYSSKNESTININNFTFSKPYYCQPNKNDHQIKTNKGA